MYIPSKCINGVMVSVLPSSTVDYGLEPSSTVDYGFEPSSTVDHGFEPISHQTKTKFFLIFYKCYKI